MIKVIPKAENKILELEAKRPYSDGNTSPQKKSTLTKLTHKHPYIVALIATALDHYDIALYGLMAPVLVGIFLPQVNTVSALIMAYCITPLGMISRPLGALVIGSLGDKWGRKKALMLSVWGMALTTMIIGCLPTYAQIGIAAPILLACLKLIQDFFLAGGYSGGAIFTLEHTKKSNKSFWSGLYTAATAVGVLSASLAANIIAHFQGCWRLAYLLAFFTGLLALYIRKNLLESPEFLNQKAPKQNQWKNLRTQFSFLWKNILAGILVTFCYSTLTKMVQVFMNVFILKVTSIPLATVMTVHTLGLLMFLIVLPIFGRIADKINFKQSMFYGALATLVLSFPLFKILEWDSLKFIICMKVVFVLLSAWFVAPFHAFMQNLFTVDKRYTCIAFSYAIGTRIGSGMIPLALYLWDKTSLTYLPCAVLMVGAILGILGLKLSNKS